MLKRTVPTPVTKFEPPARAGGSASASMMNTSRSGSEKGGVARQPSPNSFSQRSAAGLNFTMRLVGGAPGGEPGGGGGEKAPPPRAASEAPAGAVPPAENPPGTAGPAGAAAGGAGGGP